MSFPQQNVLYRIKSVDFDTYLELWDVDEDRVVTRSLKDTNLQQWLFILDGPADTYRILSAATQSLSYQSYLAIPPPDPAQTGTTDDKEKRVPVALPDITNESRWRISKQGDGSYTLTVAGKNPRQPVFLKVNKTGQPISTESKMSNSRLADRNRRWQIVEYWTPIPQDTYRIRTLNGAALDIDSNLTSLSVAAVRKDYRQEWKIEPKGNSKCVISSGDDKDKDKVYLGWERGKDGLAQVAVSKAPAEWFVKTIGDFTYTITFDYVVDARTTLTLALSITDEEVLLKPRKIAHNQIWFFEVVDAASSSTSPPPYTSGDRYPEIVERAYSLLNVGRGNWAQIITSPWYITPSGSRAYNNYIQYVAPKSNQFRWFYANTTQYVRFSGTGTSIVTGVENATNWVLDRANDPSGGYLYYICLASDRNMVVTGYTTTVAGYTQFQVTTKDINNKYHQWKFE